MIKRCLSALGLLVGVWVVVAASVLLFYAVQHDHDYATLGLSELIRSILPSSVSPQFLHHTSLKTQEALQSRHLQIEPCTSLSLPSLDWVEWTNLHGTYLFTHSHSLNPHEQEMNCRRWICHNRS